MSRRWLLIAILMLISSQPFAVHAVGMGGMGGMGDAGSMTGMVDKLSIQTKSVGTVVFSHSVHGTRCNACHPQLFKKKNNSNHVTMELMERGRSCGACHNGRKAFSVKGDCVKCHAEQPAQIEANGASHKTEIDCRACHAGHRPSVAKNIPQCSECHEGSAHYKVDNCLGCHNPHQPLNISIKGEQKTGTPRRCSSAIAR